LREASWILKVSISVLSDWDHGFDENMRPFNIADARGKAAKITPEMVRMILREAEKLKSRGKPLRLKGFTERLRKTKDIHLSKRKVREVLIANNLFAVRTRKRRPRFYQSLRKKIPNALLSLDGSELTVYLDEECYKFNVDLSVDVKTFAHTGFSVGDSESSDELIKVLEEHRKDWGPPLGVLCDHGSSNLSDRTRKYLRKHGIELVPVGPANPKGNGTVEGAFSQLKQALGTIQLDLSSPKSLARSVLEKLVSLYINMRNRIPVKTNIVNPLKGMGMSGSKRDENLEREQIKDHIAVKIKPQDEQIKVDHLYGLCELEGVSFVGFIVATAHNGRRSSHQR